MYVVIVSAPYGRRHRILAVHITAEGPPSPASLACCFNTRSVPLHFFLFCFENWRSDFYFTWRENIKKYIQEETTSTKKSTRCLLNVITVRTLRN